MKSITQIIQYILCVLMFLFYGKILSYSQTEQKNEEDTEIEDFAYLGKNEIKLNIGYSIIGIPEVTYERLFANLYNAVGISIGKSYKNINPDYFGTGSEINIAITGYYRMYFGKKISSGFFIEGNAIYYRESEAPISQPNFKDNYDRIGIGTSIGLKLVRYDGWLIEVLIGGGRVINKSERSFTEGNFGDAYPRLALSIGYRF